MGYVPSPQAAAVGQRQRVGEHAPADGPLACLGADVQRVGGFVGEHIQAGEPHASDDVRLVVKIHPDVIAVLPRVVDAAPSHARQKGCAVVADAHRDGVALL